MLAFFAPVVAATKAAARGSNDDFALEVCSEPAKPTPPEFKWKWWYSRQRLDGRAVIWSLRNRPEEWTYNRVYFAENLRGLNRLRHDPSRHEFYVDGRGLVENTQCDCSTRTSRKFQSFSQRVEFSAAALAFINRLEAPAQTAMHRQFMAHFLPAE